jgi:prevent-host-death family protein
VKRASITEAKNRLSALLDRVRHGETIIIEDRGVPVARLVPLAGASPSLDGDRLAGLERQGIIRPPRDTRVTRRLLTAPARPRKAVSLSSLVRAERESGW